MGAETPLITSLAAKCHLKDVDDFLKSLTLRHGNRFGAIGADRSGEGCDILSQ
jgi:hypothetical protein